MNSKPDLHYHDILDTEPELTVMVIMIMMMIPIRSQASVPSVSQWSTWEVPPATPFRYATLYYSYSYSYSYYIVIIVPPATPFRYAIILQYCNMHIMATVRMILSKTMKTMAVLFLWWEDFVSAAAAAGKGGWGTSLRKSLFPQGQPFSLIQSYKTSSAARTWCFDFDACSRGSQTITHCFHVLALALARVSK